jgi:hypothetical protein
MTKRPGAQRWRKQREAALCDGFRALSPRQLDEQLAELEARERRLLQAAAPPTPSRPAAELERLRNRLDRLQRSRPFRLADVLFGAQPSTEERRLSQEIRGLENAARLAADAAADRAEKARQELAAVRASIRAAKLVRRQVVGERTRAQAAAFRDQAREPAAALRRQSRAPERCPYCLQKAERWELDHIHPVSKGGLSLESNCVMVCADCNQAKGTLLLRQFCKENGWNFDAVAGRLEEMGKDI